MSFGDLYTAEPTSPVGSRAPGLPPIDLPPGPPQKPLSITVHPEPIEEDVSPWGKTQPRYKGTTEPEPEVSPWGATQERYSEERHAEIKKDAEVSTGSALGRSLASGGTFGFEPVLEGFAAASGEPAPSTIEERSSGSAAFRPIKGLINMLREHDSGTEGPAWQAYREARDQAQQGLEAARQQHPLVSLGGEALGSLAAPVPGTALLAQGANLGTRIARGIAAGAQGGTLYGAGTAASKGENLPQALQEVGASGLTGAAFGGAFHGALGPRYVNPNSPGKLAAATAESLGAPIPKGLASDNAAINSFTSKLRSFPLLGSRVSNAVDETQRAAGERIAQIAAGNRGVPPNRALAGVSLRTALEDVKEANNDKIGQAYKALSRVVNTTKFASLKSTKATLEAIRSSRRGARKANPDAGLEDVINMVYGGKGGTFGGGISFNGLQRTRSDMGQKISFFKTDPNPGMTMPEMRRLYGSMTSDMEEAVRKHTTISPDAAVNLLHRAHAVAQTLIERNGTIQRVLNVRNDESLAGSLISAAQEKGGNLRLLSDLKASMLPDDFHHIAGTMLAELGQGPNGEFSLGRFVSGWEKKVSSGARQIMFSPDHLRQINNIVGLGEHIKGALRESNVGKSETAGVLVLFDLARDAVMFAAAAGAGTLSGAAMGTSALAATPGVIFAHWLTSPAKAASMSRWITAYRVMTLGVPTPAHQAAFNIATRNLANTLGVPAAELSRRALESRGVLGGESQTRQ